MTHHFYLEKFMELAKKKFVDVADEFLKFIEGKKIIIHNADFDISHLNNELSLINKQKILKENIIDTLELARNKYPGSGVSLDALCRRFRIDNSKREKHSALIDCELLSKVYVNLIDQKEPIFQFQDNAKKQFKNLREINVYCKKIVKVSDDEIKLHKDFLKKNLKKNYF